MSQQAFVMAVDSLPRASTEAIDKLGEIRFELNKVYKFIMLKLVPDADVDGVAGDQVLYTDYSAHEVGTDATDADGTLLAAGILTAAVDMSADKGKYMWIQIKGPATMAQAFGSDPNIGEAFGPSTTDLEFTGATTLKQRCGISLHIVNKEIILDCTY